MSATRALRKARLCKGAKLELRVTVPAAIGQVVTHAVTGGRKPRPITRCLQPGASKRSAC